MVGGTTGIEPDKDTGRNQQSRCIISRSKNKQKQPIIPGPPIEYGGRTWMGARREVVDVNDRE